MKPSQILGIAGDVSASFASEYEGKKIESYTPGAKK